MAALRLSSSRTPLLLLLGWPLLASCDRAPSAAQPLHPGDVRTFVTPDVAAQLTPEGRFPLAGPAPERYPQISPEKAAEIAVAWARTFGRFHAPYLEGQHGRPIDFGRLRVISPVYYAAGVYEPVTADASPAARNTFGPYYLAYLGTDAGPVLSVAVASFSEAWVENGRLRYPPTHGGDVVAQGLSAGLGYTAPPSPERAVRIAGSASAARVTAAPVLLRPHRDQVPQHARWKIALDREVRAKEKGTGHIRTTRAVYVGLRGEVFLPAEAQPDSGDTAGNAGRGEPRLRRRSDLPVVFIPAEILSRDEDP